MSFERCQRVARGHTLYTTSVLGAGETPWRPLRAPGPVAFSSSLQVPLLSSQCQPGAGSLPSRRRWWRAACPACQGRLSRGRAPCSQGACPATLRDAPQRPQESLEPNITEPPDREGFPVGEGGEVLSLRDRCRERVGGRGRRKNSGGGAETRCPWVGGMPFRGCRGWG